MENSNHELAKTEVTAMGKFRNLLNQETIKAKFNEALGKKGPLFMSNLVTIMSSSVELQKCEPMSVISSALMAASMDLSITPGLGFAGIVPYWDTPTGTMRAQFQVMKKGYIQLAQRTGLFKNIHVCDVCDGEIKSYNKFTGEYVFDESNKKSDKIVGYVSYFRLINGFEKYYYMPIEKLDAHARKYSKSFQRGKGKWADKEQGGYEQMCEKTVLKLNLSTYAPLSVDINMMNAIVYDQAEIRDLDAKDFDYLDNEESHKPEEKEVLSIGQDKTVVIEKNAGIKSEKITQVVNDKLNPQKYGNVNSARVQDATIAPVAEQKIEATRGSASSFNGTMTFKDNAGNESQKPVDQEVIVPRDPRLKEGQFTLEEMEKMNTDVLKELANKETEMIEAMDFIPGKNTNKKLREIIFAWQIGELAALVAPYMQQQNDAGSTKEGEVPNSPGPMEDPLNKPNMDFDKQGNVQAKGIGAVMNKHNIVVPDFDKGQQRDFSTTKNLYNALAGLGIDNNKFLSLIAGKDDLKAKYPDKETFCKFGSVSEITDFLNSI